CGLVALRRHRQGKPRPSFRHWRNVRLVAPDRLECTDSSAPRRLARPHLVRGDATAGLGVLSAWNPSCDGGAVDGVAARRPVSGRGKTRAWTGAAQPAAVL